MKHLNAEDLSALLDGALPAGRREAAERHLAGCPACRDELAALTEQDARLAGSLTHDPGDAYFERFAERVAERIRPASVAPTSWWERLLAPRGLALAGSAAAVIAVAGLVWMQSRESGTAALRNPDLTRYEGQTAPAPATAAPEGAATEEAPASPMRADVRQDSRDAAESAAPTGENERRAMEEGVGKLRAGAPPSPAGAEPKALPVDRLDAREKQVARGGEAGRMLEVRKSADGEPIPVSERGFPGETNAAPPEPAPAPSSGGVTVQKPRPRASSEALRAPTPSVQSLTKREEGLAQTSPEAAPLADADERGSVRVCGVIVDGEGRPVVGAQVTVVESGKGAVSGADGRYCVEASPGARTLSVLSIGFRRVRREIQLAAGAQGPVDFRLEAVNVLQQEIGITGSRAKGMPSAALETHVPAPWPVSVLPLVGRADSLMAVADHGGRAAGFESAAATWRQVADAVSGLPSAPRARLRQAEMLHRAWKAEPTPARKAAALAAVRAYLDTVPSPPATDPARRWLRELAR